MVEDLSSAAKRSLLNRYVLPCVLLLSLPPGVSADMNQAYQDGRKFGRSNLKLKGDSSGSNARRVVPRYSGADVPQSKLYQNPSALGDEAAKAVNDNEAARFLNRSFADRPMIVIEPRKDPVTTRSRRIQQDPRKVAGDPDNTVRKCKTVQTGCTTRFKNVSCDEVLRTEQRQCSRSLVVTVRRRQTCTQGTWYKTAGTSLGSMLQVYCDLNDRTHLRFRFAPSVWGRGVCAPGSVPGNILWKPSPYYLADFKIPYRNSYPPNKTVWISRDPLKTGGPLSYVGKGSRCLPVALVLERGGCDANNDCRFRFRSMNPAYGRAYYRCAGSNMVVFPGPCPDGSIGQPVGGYLLQINFKRPVSEYLETDRWDDQCAGLASRLGKTCELVSSVCVDGPSSRQIGGTAVKRKCWRYRQTYRCWAGPSANDCKVLRKRGCEQTHSRCIARFPGSGVCSVFKQTLRCPVRTCTRTRKICGAQLYCLNGKCDDRTYRPDPNYPLAASVLSALDNAAKDFDAAADEIFKGTARRCRKAAAGFANCCKIKGWGVDAGLAQCSEGEQLLARAREAGRCHYLGSFCSSKVLNWCVRRSDSFCCFGSKIGRIIHQQGRVQLGISWGSPRNPVCRAFSVAEFQRLDFARMDFSEFYQDIMAGTTLPDIPKTRQRMHRQIRDYFNRKAR